jgi:aspartate aminotransferase
MKLSAKALGISPSITLKVTAMAKKMQQEGRDVVGFGAGEPDFDTPAHIVEAAKEALGMGLTRYTPSSGTVELRKAIAEHLMKKYGLVYAPGEIVVSNGAKHSLFNAFAAILNPGDEVIIPVPFWLTYPELVRMHDGIPVYLETDHTFKATAESIRRAITKNTKALILNSPSNPCGAVYTRAEMEAIASLAVEKEIFVISDEIYDELIYEGEHVSIASLGEDIKRLTILVNGLSKTYAMTGWRIGYTASTKQIADLMDAYQSHATSNPNSIAQHASIAALNGPQDDVKRMREAFDKRRKLLCELINGIDGLSCAVPGGAFYVMMNISGAKGKSIHGEAITGSLDFTELLLKYAETAVVPGISFGADDFVRLSYATSEDNIRKGMARIKDFMRSLQ